MRSRAWLIVGSLAICGLLGLVACGEKAQEVKARAPVEVGPELEAILARADLADGTEDHVVSKCPGCSLAMEGKAEHASEVGEYALHFCSDSCRDRFEANPTEVLLALELPEESESEATP